jgi:hypothetical protein
VVGSVIRHIALIGLAGQAFICGHFSSGFTQIRLIGTHHDEALATHAAGNVIAWLWD